ncbi:MAG: glycerol-3-phosphate 1-O-acyltransferase PlsY [Desulfobacterales bacterium]|nr:glycerol-3-phosphate 1-O-acyltransferase PlsY [Desulfobacterales bacterium]
MNSSDIWKLIALPFFAYALGSIPWGLVLTRLFTSVDIRKEGSGNIGATNVMRIAGAPLGVSTLAGDVLKGFIPVLCARLLAAGGGAWADFYLSVVVLAAIGGHLYPVYMKFKDGGKGVATTFGCFLALSPLSVLAALLVFILVVRVFNRVSAGSLAAVSALPPAVWMALDSGPLTGCALVAAIFIFVRHKENIGRLLDGSEAAFRGGGGAEKR